MSDQVGLDVLAISPGPTRRELDMSLARLVELWPDLSRSVQAGILEIAETEATPGVS
jgi:hypothetical protein